MHIFCFLAFIFLSLFNIFLRASEFPIKNIRFAETGLIPKGSGGVLHVSSDIDYILTYPIENFALVLRGDGYVYLSHMGTNTKPSTISRLLRHVIEHHGEIKSAFLYSVENPFFLSKYSPHHNNLSQAAVFEKFYQVLDENLRDLPIEKKYIPFDPDSYDVLAALGVGKKGEIFNVDLVRNNFFGFSIDAVTKYKIEILNNQDPTEIITDGEKEILVLNKCTKEIIRKMNEDSFKQLIWANEGVFSKSVEKNIVFCGNRECNKDLDPEDLKKCGRCWQVYYCNKECQKAHWPKHKQSCKERSQIQAE